VTTTGHQKARSYKGFRPGVLMDGHVVGEGRRGLRKPATAIHGDLHPPILLSADVGPPRLSVRFLVEASGAGRGCAPRRAERRSEGKGSTEMIRVTVEIREGALTYRVRVTAPSIERALEIVGEGKPGRRVRLVFPIDPEAFFVTEDSGRREAA
jgi:hypothetical protein